jgi:hypothetical protein
MPRRLTVRITNKPTGKLRATRLSAVQRMSLGAGPIAPPLAGRLGAGPAVTAEVTGDLVTLHGVVERAYQKSCGRRPYAACPA